MPRNLTSGRSSTDPLAILGGRQEMIGWALLILWGVLWLFRGIPAGQVASRMEATASIDLAPHGTEAQLREAFDAARKSCAAEATLTLLTGSQIHSRSTFIVHVVADTADQALAGRAAMTKAMEATAPEEKRPFRVEANPSSHPSKVWNDRMQRVSIATTLVLLLFGSSAQVLVVLGSSKQVGIRPVDLWMKLVAPFLFLLGNGAVGNGGNHADRNLHGESLSDALAPFIMFFLPILAVSVIPAFVILWLTRRSGNRSGHRSGPSRRNQP